MNRAVSVVVVLVLLAVMAQALSTPQSTLSWLSQALIDLRSPASTAVDESPSSRRAGPLGSAVTERRAASSVELQNAEDRAAKPGEYVTLGFPVNGSGEFRFQLISPDGWSALSSSKTVSLDGDRTIIFNVRVPLEALADVVARFTLNAYEGEQARGSATGDIRVLSVGGVRMRAPDEARIRVGDPVKLEVFVTNTGNRRDTFRIVPQRAIWPVLLEPASFSLDVNETRSVTVTVTPQQQITNGYIFLLRLRGESSLDAESKTEIQVLFRFGTNTDKTESPNPQLTLSVNLGLQPSLILEGAKDPEFNTVFSIVPSLGGQLSDYVKGSLDLGGSGVVFSIKDGLSLPSGINFGVRGETWDSNLQLTTSGATWSINYAFAEWRLSNELAYTILPNAQRLRTNTTIKSLREDLPLEFFVGASGTAGTQSSNDDARSDALGANYQTNLAENLALDAGLALTGSSSGGSPYSFGLSLNESLAWQLEAVELLQTYTSAPFSAQHNFSLFAALRDTTPFGLRGSTTLNLVLNDPVQFTWRNSVVGTVNPVENLNFSATASYNINTAPNYNIGWTAGAQASYGFRIPGFLFGAVSASYNHVGVIVGDIAESDTTGAGLQIDAGNVQFSLEGSFKYTSATTTTPSLETTRVSARAAYAFSSSSALFSTYSYNLDVSAAAVEKHELVFGWGQVWSAQISTTLSYSRTLIADFVNPNKNGDALNATFTVRDFLTEGLTLNFGWRWSGADGSIFDGAFISQHRFTLGLGYTLELPFDTPAFLVGVFGGRRSGGFSGVAYRDLNLNGVRDPDEPAIPNLTINLGRDGMGTTDAQGRFDLRAPVGKYNLEFPKGLEAGLDLLGEREANIELNQTLKRDLGFAPVTTLEVSLFDDANNNGLRDPDEASIPFGGVKIVGPVTKQVRVDGNGNAVVSGMVDGVYTVVPDGTQLPADYRATTQPVVVTVKTPDTPAKVAVGAALPPRVVETTYESGTLAVFASASNTQLPAGADLRLEALTQGKVERVTAQLGNLQIELTKSNDRWLGTLRLPVNLELGEQIVIVRAYASGQTTEFEVAIQIVDAPLFRPGKFEVETNQDVSFTLFTLYKASPGQLTMLFPDGQRVILESADGYEWRGRWKAPAAPTKLEAQLFDGDKLLGKLSFTVIAPAPKTLAQGAGALLEQIWKAITTF